MKIRPLHDHVLAQRVAGSAGTNEERPIGSVGNSIGQMEAQLLEWSARIDELGLRTEKAAAEVGADQRRHLRQLRAMRRTAQASLAALKEAGADKWESFKVDIETAWKDLEVAFRKLEY